jgi:hypothetical protein
MRANTEETIVISAQALVAPTTTLGPGRKNQAKLDAIKRSRLDGTYDPPEGMVEWQRMNRSGNAREWVIWRNNQKAAAVVAKNREIKLPPVETRPFNYSRINEDEAPHLHVLSFERNKGDDAEGGNEHFSPSSIEDNLTEDNLGDALDRLLNSSSSVSPLNGTNQKHEQGEDDLVDYSEEDDEEDFIRNENAKTMSAKTFADNHTEVEARGNPIAEDEDKLGDEDFTQSESRGSTSEGQLKGNDREAEAQESAIQLAEMNDNTPVAKPVLTQKGIMDIISKQPHALMQKMEWEQKKQCYKEMLSGYESPNGTSMWQLISQR